MDSIYNRWAVWYISASNDLLYIDFIGDIQECINIVRPRRHGSWAILPYDPKNK